MLDILKFDNKHKFLDIQELQSQVPVKQSLEPKSELALFRENKINAGEGETIQSLEMISDSVPEDSSSTWDVQPDNLKKIPAERLRENREL